MGKVNYIQQHNKLHQPQTYKMDIKCSKLKDDQVDKGEEIEETENIDLKKVWEMCQNIAKDVKEIKSKIEK